jgi:hypothetical protein
VNNIHGPMALHAALATIITNLPSHTTAIDIRLRPDEVPLATITMALTGPDGEVLVDAGPTSDHVALADGVVRKVQGTVQTCTQRFKLVPIEDVEG